MTRSLSFPSLEGHVFFASTRSVPGAKPDLTRRLLRELARHNARWSALTDGESPSLRKSALGRPYLMLGNTEGPSLSFSHGGGRLWAAICGTGCVGIDLAYAEEFEEGYPLARAFRPQELDWAHTLLPRDTSRGAALLWSLKEASLKSIGSGFHLFDPLDVRVVNPRFLKTGLAFEVLAGGRAIPAWSTKEGNGWLSLAWV